MGSYIWVSDENNFYVGQYKDLRNNHGGGQGSHARLAAYTGVGLCGGAINPSRPDYVNGIGYNSETLNRPSFGVCNIGSTSTGQAMGAKIASGDYYKAYNMGGGMGRVWYNSKTDDIQVLY